MNEKLSRPQFNQMDTTEKQALMESLAAHYDMTFLGLHTFDRWGQSCITGIFEKDGREFVFVPGDTVTLGWEQFAVGLNQELSLIHIFDEAHIHGADFALGVIAEVDGIVTVTPARGEDGQVAVRVRHGPVEQSPQSP